jgi:hypothetical protein
MGQWAYDPIESHPMVSYRPVLRPGRALDPQDRKPLPSLNVWLLHGPDSGSDMSWDRRKEDSQEGSQSRPDDGPPRLRRHEPLLHEENEQTGVALPFPS